MDRLVCGDVGFGKTEVALRAAFVAAMGGKQVAFWRPPRCWPSSTTRPGGPLRQMAGQGGRDVALPLGQGDQGRHQGHRRRHGGHRGRHAQAAVRVHQFKNLGLLIIDEEHRFGVRHKEAMKALRAEVDVLTLTATPIPRTWAWRWKACATCR
jgi:transcription-repair coupling factor (superfamily II helicase)